MKRVTGDSATSSRLLMAFEQLGPYRLGKKLGQGGMGAVYEGIDTDTGEPAAVKVLAPALAMEEGFRVRFEAEIESLKKLRHPNIVTLYGHGEQGGTLFYAMERIDGTTLEDEIRANRRFDWREVTQIGIKLCKALKHAHDHGVIHRDLKPANVMITPDGELKLADFGIARLFGNTRLTSDGGVLGTAEYMAPEQADGRAVTERCDQYSLGGVLYALLAGRPPFRAKTLVEMLQLQRFAEPEPVTRFAPQTPAELARIVHQLLEKDPPKRFANALILARSLEAMERGLSISLSRGDDFVLNNPGDTREGSISIAMSSAGTDYDPASPTLSPEELAKLSGSVSNVGAGTSNPQITEATLAFGAVAERTSTRAAAESPPAQTTGGRFTKVSQQSESVRVDWGEALLGVLSPQTLALVAALALLFAGGWYLMREPSADQLFERIRIATDGGDASAIARADDDIKSFLERFPDDSRAESLQTLQDEARQGSPLERAYGEAMRSRLVNPELALAKFQAIIDTYDDGEATPDSARHYVSLARVQQKRLQKRVDDYVADGRKLLASRLAKAKALADSDPQTARKIYSGIVELYGDKPWADELVSQAKVALAAQGRPANVGE